MCVCSQARRQQRVQDRQERKEGRADKEWVQTVTQLHIRDKEAAKVCPATLCVGVCV